MRFLYLGGASVLPAAEQLRTAVHTLHLRAGRPAPSDIAVASRWVLTAGTVASVPEGTVLPPRDVLQKFVRLLGGDVDRMTQLLDNAHREAAHPTTALHPASRPEADPTPTVPRPASSTPPATASLRTGLAGPDTVMRTFSKVLTEDRPVEEGRARLLDHLAEQNNPQADRERRTTLAALKEARRQRELPPPRHRDHPAGRNMTSPACRDLPRRHSYTVG